jgi:hypothetical protein
LERTPENTISTSIGIARYPSGIQPCKGNGHLDEERGGEEQEDPLLRALAQRQCLQRGEHKRDVTAALLGGEHAGGDRGGEHQQRADQRVDHELDRRFHSVGPCAPTADQEVERDQHQVEEGHEQRQVLREEGAEHGRLGEHEVEVEELRPLPRAHVGRQHGGGEQQRGQSHEEHVQATDAELVVDAQRRDPDDVGDVLQRRPAAVEIGDVTDREAQGDDRSGERQRARNTHQA